MSEKIIISEKNYQKVYKIKNDFNYVYKIINLTKFSNDTKYKLTCEVFYILLHRLISLKE